MAEKYKEKQDALMVETSEHTKSIRADFKAPAPVRLHRVSGSVLMVHGNLYALGTFSADMKL